MVETARRGPGRPSYDSKQKLISAMCSLLAERGYEATSPKMILQRAGVGQGSLYHHFRGKEDLALEVITRLMERSTAFLEGQYALRTSTGDDDEIQSAPARVVTSTLERLFTRAEGQALIRLLADPAVAVLPRLIAATRQWCEELQATIIIGLRADAPDEDPESAEDAARILAPEFNTHAQEGFASALGKGLQSLLRVSRER